MEVRRCEDDAQFPQQFIQDIVAVGQSREFDAVAVHVQYRGFLPGDDEFSQIAQCRGLAAEELNQCACIR